MLRVAKLRHSMLWCSSPDKTATTMSMTTDTTREDETHLLEHTLIKVNARWIFSSTTNEPINSNFLSLFGNWAVLALASIRSKNRCLLTIHPNLFFSRSHIHVDVYNYKMIGIYTPLQTLLTSHCKIWPWPINRHTKIWSCALSTFI